MTDLAGIVLEVGRTAHLFAAVNRSLVNWPDGENPESDTDHTVFLAWLAPALAARLYPELDVNLVCTLAAVHDAVEAFCGDVNTFGATADLLAAKYAAESAAVERWQQLFQAALPWLPETIERYERQAEPEARFVRMTDKLLPIATHITDRCTGLFQGGKTRRDFELALEETLQRMRGIGGTEFPLLLELAADLAASALTTYDAEVEAKRVENVFE